MKKTILFFLSIVFLLPSRAETISQKQASQLAQLFFNEVAGRVVAPPKLVYNGKKLTTGRLFSPFYVYNNMLGGFVIISAENKAFPILGFSFKDSFDPNNLSDAETALLRSYAREIELIRYESEPVPSAEEAWINFPKYVNSILSAKYSATDPVISPAEADKIVESAEIRDEAIYSDIYTPLQWQEMIIEELKAKASVPLILVEGHNSFPAVIYGHQGDYFRIEMEKRNNWLMRLNSTENISTNMISAVVNPINLLEEASEDVSFKDFDEFLNEVTSEEASRSERSSIERIDLDALPQIHPLGSGHYEVLLPEEGRIALVYNLSGALVSQSTFHNTNVLNVDITAEPRGFYFLTVIGQSGRPYGMKLVR